MKNKTYITEKIGEQYREWHSEGVIIASGTDTGKTTFIINTLLPYALLEGKNALYLVNRKSLYEQIKAKIIEYPHVKIMTYQALQALIRKNIEIPHYDYIIADECHYFLTDGIFNQYTDIAFSWLRSQSDNVVIYMSATGNNLFNGLTLSGIVKPERYYYIPQNHDNIEAVYFYNKNQITKVIDNIMENNPNDKILVFVNSIKRLKEMYCIYGDVASYLCSRFHAKDKTLSFVDYECVQNFQFAKKILFATKSLDNGVDLKDRRIKHVFSEIIDVDSSIQAIGRKRPEDAEDTYNLYFLRYDNRAIRQFAKIEESDLLPVQKLMYDRDAFMSEYGTDRELLRRNKILYGEMNDSDEIGTIYINHIVRQKFEYDVKIYNEMISEGYETVLLKLLGKDFIAKTKKLKVEKAQTDKFLEYLQSVCGQKLFKPEQKILKEKFKTILHLYDNRMGIHTLNGKLKDCGYQFMITAKKEKKRNSPNRNKTYWLIAPLGQ